MSDPDLAEDAARDYLYDLLRPIGVDRPESVAEALFLAGLTIVPAAPHPSPVDPAEVREVLAKLRHLHRRSEDTVEIEVYVNGDCCERDVCPDCDEYGQHDEIREIHICNECGVDISPEACDLPYFRPWPCPTAELLASLSAPVPPEPQLSESEVDSFREHVALLRS